MIAACGDGIAGPDAAVGSDAGERGLVRVRVENTEFLGEALVYFQERDSTISLVTRIDGEGRAAGFLSPHGFVTVVSGIKSGVVPMYTYADVSPGDTLVVNAPQLDFNDRRFINLRIPEEPTTSFYELHTACTSTNVTPAVSSLITIELPGCGPVTDMIVIAHASMGQRYLYRDRVDLAQDITTVGFTGSYRPVDMPLLSIRAPSVESFLIVGHGILLGSRDPFTLQQGIDVSSGMGTRTSPLPAPAEATAQATILPDGPFERVLDWRPAKPEITLDLADYDLRDQLEPARYERDQVAIVWGEASDGLVGEYVLADLRWSTPTTYQWHVLARRWDEAAIVRLPTLPELVPSEDVVLQSVARLHVTGGAVDAMTQLLGRWQAEDFGPAWPYLGEEGSVIWQSLEHVPSQIDGDR